MFAGFFGYVGNFVRTRPLFYSVILFLLIAQFIIREQSFFTVASLLLLVFLFFWSIRKFSIGLIFLLMGMVCFMVLFLLFQRSHQIAILRDTYSSSKETYQLEVLEIKQSIAKKTISGIAVIRGGNSADLRVWFHGPLAEETVIYPHTILKIRTEMERLYGQRVPGGFNSAEWTAKQGVYVQMFWFHADDLLSVHSDSKRFRIEKIIIDFRRKLAESFHLWAGEEAGAVIPAMLYGDESYLTEEAELFFEDLGLSHVLVASGTNVSICLAHLMPISKHVVKKSKNRLWLHIIALIGLTGLSLGEAAMLRASITKVLELFQTDQAKKTIKDNYLYTSVFIISLLNPYMLLQTGFLMSCLATQAIYFLNEIDDTKRENDFSLIKNAGEMVLYRIRLYPFLQLILLPLTWEVGKEYSLAQFLANLLCLPLTELVLTWSVLFVLTMPFRFVNAWLGLILKSAYELFYGFGLKLLALSDFSFRMSRYYLALLLLFPWRIFLSSQSHPWAKYKDFIRFGCLVPKSVCP